MNCFYTKPAFWIGSGTEMGTFLTSDYRWQNSFSTPNLVYELDEMTISIFKDGLIGIEFRHLIADNLKKTLRLLEYFNSLSFSFYNSINLGIVPNKSSLDPYSLNDKNFIALTGNGIGFGDGSSYNSKVYFERKHGALGILRSLFFSKEELLILLERFNEEVKNEKTWLLSYLNRLMSHYHEHYFLEAFIDAFFIIEVLLNKLWSSYLSSNKVSVNKKRKEYLTGKDMTLAVKINILQLCNVITLDLFNKIDSLRKRRNEIVHNIEKVASSDNFYNEDFQDVFEVINELIVLTEGIKIKLTGSHWFRTFD